MIYLTNLVTVTYEKSLGLLIKSI